MVSLDRLTQSLRCNRLLAVPQRFDVVLITEWISSSDATRSAALTGLLEHILGPSAPSALSPARAGVASPAALAGSATGSSVIKPRDAQLGAAQLAAHWGVNGLGDRWRSGQAPRSVIQRLTLESSLDLELYAAAAELVAGRVLESVGSSPGN